MMIGLLPPLISRTSTMPNPSRRRRLSSCHACHGIALHEGNRTRSGGLERAPELLPGTSRCA